MAEAVRARESADAKGPPGTRAAFITDLDALFLEFLETALSANDQALQGATDVLTRRPGIDYVRVEAPAPDGEPGGLLIERPAAPGGVIESSPALALPVDCGLRVWHEGSAAMPRPLCERGLVSALQIPLAHGALTVGSRGPSASSPSTVAWCRAAARVLEAVLERRQMETELLRLERGRALGELAASTAHDFNNVLTGVMAVTTLLREQISDVHPAQQCLRMLDMLAASGAELGAQLLSFARDRGTGTEAVDVNEVVHQVCTLMRHGTPANIEVESELERPLPLVNGIPALLRLMLTNLVLNASNAMPGGGRVVVRTRFVPDGADRRDGARRLTPRGHICVEVIDGGTGIAPEALSRLFEPFFTTKSESGGSGLGLTSVRRIVERHGGRVEVASTVGAGSAFTVVLPVQPG